MPTTTDAVTGAGIKQAIETRDDQALAGFYADNAVVRIVDRDHPPSHPREIRGRQAISAYWADICGRDMVHQVDTMVAEGDRLAFTEACAYPDGTRVLCAATLSLKDGRIATQAIIQAWDA